MAAACGDRGQRLWWGSEAAWVRHGRGRDGLSQRGMAAIVDMEDECSSRCSDSLTLPLSMLSLTWASLPPVVVCLQLREAAAGCPHHRGD